MNREILFTYCDDNTSFFQEEYLANAETRAKEKHDWEKEEALQRKEEALLKKEEALLRKEELQLRIKALQMQNAITAAQMLKDGIKR